jgi:CheY-like chemotaxis protein
LKIASAAADDSEPSNPLSDRSSSPTSKTGPSETNAKSQRISQALVIDDEESILEMVSAALENLDCRATLLDGSSGVEAALRSTHFDFVVSDFNMPGQNGAEVYRFIRENHPKLRDRFLLMTGNLAGAEKYPAELATVPVLSKPFTIAHLRQAVTDLLRDRTVESFSAGFNAAVTTD